MYSGWRLFTFFQQIKLGVIPENLINHISHLLAMVVAFPNVLLMCGIHRLTTLFFFQKLSVGLRSKIKLISCIYRIIAATDCYIIFIARQHTDAQYWYSNSPRLSVCPSSISFCNAFYLVLANKRESNGINVIKSSAQRVPRNVSTVCWGYRQNQ